MVQVEKYRRFHLKRVLVEHWSKVITDTDEQQMKFRHELPPSLSLTHIKMIQEQGQVIRIFHKNMSAPGITSEDVNNMSTLNHIWLFSLPI